MERQKPFPCPGAWAVDENGRVGVLFLATFGQMARTEFHPVNEVGETTIPLVREWAGLRIARKDEIPAARRQDFSDEMLAELGYV
jgi:hypothetical protein